MRLDEAKKDLDWIHSLPGTKVILKGNHDYWWPSSQKLKTLLPPSIHFVHKNAFHWKNICTVGGTRLWETEEYSFDPFIEWREIRKAKEVALEEVEKKKREDRMIFLRELDNLKFSLNQLSSNAKVRIAMTHYPPIGPDLLPSEASHILEKYRIDYCVFGHLHNIKDNSLYFGEKNGISYILTSCDYLDFIPKKLFSE
jgi:hypothetical protein